MSTAPAFPRVNRAALVRVAVQLLVVAALVVLAVMNISVKGWTEMDDGVLWTSNGSDIIASEVAPGTAGSRAGLRPGDTLLAIDNRSVTSPADVHRALHEATPTTPLLYTIVRPGPRSDPEFLSIHVEGIPTGTHWLYLALAGVGLFTLFVGTAVRLRRPENQATLHFFWLSVAFFGVLTFSYTGKLDTLDWVFYWGDVVAMLLLPPLFVHFALVFPERPDSWATSDGGRALVPLV
ncbi:MAG TPA: PDZ domain-containing protein, partial [Vicinamibacterales bacterium]|nr:PDZ domain-containing protein [Vicinamibacterales bacterium]